MSAGTDGIVHYDCTRIGLIDALGNLPLGEHLHLEPRGRMADALLAQMPVGDPSAARREALLSIAAEIDLLAEEFSTPDSQAGTLQYIAERATFPAIREGIHGAAELARKAAEPQR